MIAHFITKPGRRAIITLVLALSGTFMITGCRDIDPAENTPKSEPRESYGTEECSGRCVNLRTLIISIGNSAEDPALALIKGLHDRLGTPYFILDSSRRKLAAEMLSSGNHGYYNAIILTDANLWNKGAPGKSGFTAQEWSLLHEYERRFSIREAVISGYPASESGLGIDYGMVAQQTISKDRFLGKWHPPAGGTELFENMNTIHPLPLSGYAIGARSHGDTGPQVEALLTESESGAILVALLRYADGREVLFSTINNAPGYLHSQVLAYEFLNFASKGVFIGARRVFLNAHVDDLFLPNFLWDPDSNDISRSRTYRMTPTDAENSAKSLRQLRSKYAVAQNLKLDFAFNGQFYSNRITREDKLYQTLQKYNGELFRYINHTLTHRSMDLSAGIDYQLAREEIEQNLSVWEELSLPELKQNRSVLISGEHTGLRDGDTPYPEGRNDAFLQAASDSGVRYLASDASRLNQNREQFIPEFGILLLPRFPTSLFYNVTEPEMLRDQYNFLRGEEQKPKSYREILELDTDRALVNMMSYSIWPHYFHQSNLHDYDQAGSTLLFDWFEILFAKYRRLTTLPVASVPFYEVGRLTENRLTAREAGITAIWHQESDTVTISATREAEIFITGVAGGELYGGQLVRTVSISPVPQILPVDRALEQ